VQPIELASESKGRVDVGFVTMREDEAKAIVSRLHVDREARGTRTYDLAAIPNVNGASLLVAHLRCRDQGPDEAEQTTRALIDDLAPRWIIVLGIAGTVPNEDLCLGDVAISSYVYDTRLSMNAQGGRRGYALRVPPLHSAVKDLRIFPDCAGKMRFACGEQPLGELALGT
jgi:nucleoside phosphorylase